VILRLLNIQGIAGIAVGLALAALLLIQKIETRHWKKQSTGFEQLYQQEQAALAATAGNYRAAADQARAADKANAERAAAESQAITEGTEHEFEVRLAAARAQSGRLRVQSAAAADPGAGRSPPVPGLPAATRVPVEAAGEGRLPHPDALIATEQAIQLDELIKWIRTQAKVDNGPKAVAIPQGN
jgi:hypothetical protein